MRSKSLQFLTDENVSPRMVDFLRHRGHDVQDVKENGWHGQEDLFLLQKAAQTQRFIISHDRDFGNLAIHQRQSCYGVIYLRLKDQRSANAIRVMRAFLERNLDICPGTLIILRESQARIRRVSYKRRTS